MLNRRILFLTAVIVAVVGTVAIGGAAASDASSYDQAPTNTADYSSLSDVQAEMDGSGTESDPYVVTDPYDLQAINASLGSHYVLGNDINASGTENWNSGSGFDPLGEWDPAGYGNVTANFTGTFDGQGYSINGFYINRTSEGPVGLFLGFEASEDTTDISNVGMEVNITGTTSYSPGTGGMVGNSFGNLSVSDVSISGDVTGSRNVGGVVGFVTYANGNITDVSDVTVDNVSGDKNVGGVVGFMGSGDVTDVSDVTVGNVTGSGNGVGGVVGSGYNVTDISDVTVHNVTSSGNGVGGVVGSAGSVGGGGSVGNVIDISNVRVGDVTGSADVGGVGGSVDGDITDVSDVEVGNMTGSDSYSGVGGVGGSVSYGNITDVSDVEVGDVTGGGYVGGVGGSVQENMNNVSNVKVGDVSGSGNGVGGVGGSVGDGNITDVSDVEVGDVTGSSNVGGVGGSVDGDVDNITKVVVPSLDGSYIVANSGGNISNSIIVSDSATFQSSSSANNSVVFANTVNGELNSSYTNSSWYDADGGETEIESFRESTADDTWQQIGNLETVPIVPELDLGPQFDVFGVPEMTGDGVKITIESDNPGEELTGTVQVETGVDTPIEFPVTVEMSPEEYDRVTQGTITVEDSAEYDFSFNTTERDFGNHTMVVTIGESQFTQDFELTESGVVGGGSDDTTFTSFDIPGTDISVPLLPVGGILVIGALGVGYIYYREEDVEFQ